MCSARSPKPGLFIRDRPFMDQVLVLCPRTIPIWSATKLLCRSSGGCGADEGSYGCDRCERIPALFLWPVEAAQQGGPDRRVCRRDLLNDDVEEIGRRPGEGTQCFKFVDGSSKNTQTSEQRSGTGGGMVQVKEDYLVGKIRYGPAVGGFQAGDLDGIGARIRAAVSRAKGDAGIRTVTGGGDGKESVLASCVQRPGFPVCFPGNGDPHIAGGRLKAFVVQADAPGSTLLHQLSREIAGGGPGDKVIAAGGGTGVKDFFSHIAAIAGAAFCIAEAYLTQQGTQLPAPVSQCLNVGRTAVLHQSVHRLYQGVPRRQVAGGGSGAGLLIKVDAHTGGGGGGMTQTAPGGLDDGTVLGRAAQSCVQRHSRQPGNPAQSVEPGGGSLQGSTGYHAGGVGSLAEGRLVKERAVIMAGRLG